MQSPRAIITHTFSALLLVFAYHAAHAQTPEVPAVKQLGAVTYISGGITGDERDAMRPLAKDYNLRMDFALTVGNYVSDVNIKVLNSKGVAVLDMEAGGPWLYVNLPSGKYQVSAEYAGKKVVKNVTITLKRGASLPFRWPGVKEQIDE